VSGGQSSLVAAVWGRFDPAGYQAPPEEPFTLASYRWDGNEPEAFVEPVGVGRLLIDMPLFLDAERYVNVPLERTYLDAYRGMPAYWRGVLEGAELPPYASTSSMTLPWSIVAWRRRMASRDARPTGGPTMTGDTTKAFAPIRDDNAFFETHSSEAENDLKGYARSLAGFDRGRPVRLLDFGCGDGGFTAKFLTMLGVPPERLTLSLVEPDEVYRHKAVAALVPFTRHSIDAWPAMPDSCVGCFDLAVANHVFYYVPDLDSALGQVLRGLAPGGLFLMAVAGLDNALIQFWVKAFAMLGKPVPYHTAEDVSAALRRLGAAFETHTVSYELAFADGEEDRMKILRFLLSEHLPALPRQAALDLFAPHVRDGRIVIATGHVHFLVRGTSPA
jgi:trans-aconitate 2-methyltransferase